MGTGSSGGGGGGGSCGGTVMSKDYSCCDRQGVCLGGVISIDGQHCLMPGSCPSSGGGGGSSAAPPVVISQTLIDQLKKDISNASAIHQQSEAVIKSYQNIVADTEQQKTNYNTTFSQYTAKNSEHQSEIGAASDSLKHVIQQIEDNYGQLAAVNVDHATALDTIRYTTNDGQAKSYAVAYFEGLLLAAYRMMYGAIATENTVLAKNKEVHERFNQTDNRTYLYQQQRAQFFKNLNTWFFYIYYVLLIAVFVYVQQQTPLLELNVYRFFFLLLFLYPILIYRFQTLVQWIYDHTKGYWRVY
jgi:hypothetical protein